MANDVLRVILQFDNSQYKREAKETVSATGQIGDEAKKTGTATGRMRDSMKGLGTAAKVAIAGVALLAVKNFVSGSIKAASDLDESLNAVNKTFGEGADIIDAFGDVAAATAGLSKREFNDLATVTGAMLTNMGFGMKSAAQESVHLTQRAADMASVFNKDVSVVLEAINAGLRGETEPLRQFGVQLSDAAIRAKAVSLGLAETTAEVDDNGKAQGALALIYEQSSKTAGDFLQTTDSLANANRRAAAIAENAQARWGASFARLSAVAMSAGATVLDSIAAIGGDEIAKASLRMQEAVDTINKAIRDGRDPLSALADVLLHLARTGDLTGAQFEALAVQAGLPIEKYEEFSKRVLEQGEAVGLDTQLLDELAAAMVSSSDAADRSGEAIEGAGDETEEAAEKTERLTEATKTYAETTLASLDPVSQAVSAIGKMQDAQANLVEVQKNSDSTARDVAEAQLAVAEAMLEAQGAIDLVDPTQLNNSIRGLSEILGVTEEEAMGLLEQLGLIDGKEVTATVTTLFQERRDKDSGRGARTYVGGRAGGGSFTRNEMFRAGEHNKPELMIIPGEAGQVFSHVDSRRLINALTANSGSGARSTQVGPFHLQTEADPNRIADAVAWRLRTAGV